MQVTHPRSARSRPPGGLEVCVEDCFELSIGCVQIVVNDLNTRRGTRRLEELEKQMRGQELKTRTGELGPSLGALARLRPSWL